MLYKKKKKTYFPSPNNYYVKIHTITWKFCEDDTRTVTSRLPESNRKKSYSFFHGLIKYWITLSFFIFNAAFSLFINFSLNYFRNKAENYIFYLETFLATSPVFRQSGQSLGLTLKPNELQSVCKKWTRDWWKKLIFKFAESRFRLMA